MIKISKMLLYILVFCLVLLPEEFGFKFDKLPDISVLRAILLLLSIALLFGYFADRRFSEDLEHCLRNHRLLFLILFIFFGWKILASLLSPYGLGSVGTAIRDVFYFLVPFFIAICCLHYQRAIAPLAQLIGISAAICLVIGLIEYVNGFRLYAVLTSSDSAWNIFDLEKTEFVGVLATFPHPLAMGAFMAIAMAFGMLLYSDQNGKRKYQGMMIMIVALVGIFISTSRGAQAGIFAGLVFSYVLKLGVVYRRVNSRQKLLAMILFGPLSLVFFGVILFAAGSTLVVGGDERQLSSALYRIVQVEMSVVPILARPMLGYGVGNAAEALGMKNLSVDNYYLTTALDTGLVGLSLFLLMLAVFLYRAIRLYLLYRDPSYKMLAVLLVVQYTQLLVLSLKQGLPLLYLSLALVLLAEKDALKRFHPVVAGKVIK